MKKMMLMDGQDEGSGLLWENESWAFSNSDEDDDDDDHSSGAGSGQNPPQPLNNNNNKQNQEDKEEDEEDDHQTHNNNNNNFNSPCKPPPPPPPPSSSSASAGKRNNNNNNKRKGTLINSSNNNNNHHEQQGKGCGGGGGGYGGDQSDDHEMHIWTERERRKKMRSMFSSLHALLPQLPPKADKSTIVDEAVNYIKTLEQTLHKLEKQKLERIHGVISSYDSQKLVAGGIMEFSREAFLADQGSSTHHQSNNSSSISNFSRQHPPAPAAAVFRTWVSPNVILNICGDNAHINVCCQKRLGLFTAITFFLEKNKLEVVSAQVSSDHYRTMLMIQVQVINGGGVDHFPHPAFSSVEEIFQQAAGEIMSYISSL